MSPKIHSQAIDHPEIAVIERTDQGLRALEQVTAELRAMTEKGSK